MQLLGAYIAGLAIIATGGFAIHRYRRLNRIGARVPGTVVGVRWDLGKAPHAVLAFRTLDGRDIQAVAGTGGAAGIGSRGIPRPGEQVLVIYDPGNPARADINSKAARAPWFLVIFIMTGVAIICYGVYRTTSGKA